MIRLIFVSFVYLEKEATECTRLTGALGTRLDDIGVVADEVGRWATRGVHWCKCRRHGVDRAGLFWLCLGCTVVNIPTGEGGCGCLLYVRLHEKVLEVCWKLRLEAKFGHSIFSPRNVFNEASPGIGGKLFESFN